MFERITVLIVAFAILSIGFGVVESHWPSVRGQRRLRSGFFTDAAYWLFTPTLGKLFSGIFVGVVILVLARLLAVPLTVDDLRGLTERNTTVSRQPAGLQVIEFLLLADFLAYWQHRAFHGVERLWRIHAVHHSSTELDWLSSVRVHPLNEALSNTAIAAPLLLLGFNPTTLAAYLPFLTFYAIALHANVGWSYGPLRYVVSSPAFHRWHHSAEAESLNKNFAGLFPVFDWIFGTLYLPRSRRPEVFGVMDNTVPAGLLPQLAYPLRKTQAQPAPAS